MHQRDVIETVTALEHHRLKKINDPDVVARIKQYELAFRMQTSVPQLADLQERRQRHSPRAEPGKATIGTNCLMAQTHRGGGALCTFTTVIGTTMAVLNHSWKKSVHLPIKLLPHFSLTLIVVVSWMKPL